MSNQVSPDKIKASLRRQFVKRIAIKVLAVVVVVGAFNFIRAIEAEKRGYDEAHNRPLVIVDDQFWTDCGGKSLVTSSSPIPAPSPVAVHPKCDDARLIPESTILNKLAPGKDSKDPEVK